MTNFSLSPWDLLSTRPTVSIPTIDFQIFVWTWNEFVFMLREYGPFLQDSLRGHKVGPFLQDALRGHKVDFSQGSFFLKM